MSTEYTAHIVTTEARNLGAPEIVIFKGESSDASSVYITRYDLPEGTNAYAVLNKWGWLVTGESVDVETGYSLQQVTIGNLDLVMRWVTAQRGHAQAEYRRQDQAWRLLIQDAVSDGVAVPEVASAASISRERVYQLRDNRR